LIIGHKKKIINANQPGEDLKMRTIALLALATATIAFAGAAYADSNGGGPIKKAGMCWVATSSLDQGFWKHCPPEKKHHHHT
jgi:hypothetical protein